MDTQKRRILWADDEIDLLRPHHLFLEEHGFEVTAVNNGEDAVALAHRETFDVILLDEMMPGIDGLSALEQIKSHNPNVPVVMITKNEEEHVMNEAIGRRIDDYLTKPVNPSQIFLACKKILDSRQIQQSQAGQNYVSKSAQINTWLTGEVTWQTWIDIHRLLCEWDIEIEHLGDHTIDQMLADQRKECNHEFARFIERHYSVWVGNEDESPALSVDVISEFVHPLLKEGRQVCFVVVDCLRLDQWMVMESLLTDFFEINRSYHYSILPTATPYSRNAIFSGLFPNEIAAKYGDLWKNASEDGSLNRHEHRFIEDQLKDLGTDLEDSSQYVKVIDPNEGHQLARRMASPIKTKLVSVVYNFLDMLVHGRSHSELLKEIAPDESAFRSLVQSWFSHSSLFQLLRQAARSGASVVLTTDHGCVRGTRAAIVHGDRNTSTHLRFKVGKNLRCDRKASFFIADPALCGLPRSSLGTNYLVAKEDFYFVYPSNFNEFQRQYRGNFQHGGISLDEMILPVAVMVPKGGVPE